MTAWYKRWCCNFWPQWAMKNHPLFSTGRRATQENSYFSKCWEYSLLLAKIDESTAIVSVAKDEDELTMLVGLVDSSWRCRCYSINVKSEAEPIHRLRLQKISRRAEAAVSARRVKWIQADSSTLLSSFHQHSGQSWRKEEYFWKIFEV